MYCSRSIYAVSILTNVFFPHFTIQLGYTVIILQYITKAAIVDVDKQSIALVLTQVIIVMGKLHLIQRSSHCRS